MLILNIHSVADIITNSSTELFICNTDLTEEAIREWFESLQEVSGQPHGVGTIITGNGVEDLIAACEVHMSDYYVNSLETILNIFLPYDERIELPRYIEPKWSKDTDWVLEGQRRLTFWNNNVKKIRRHKDLTDKHIKQWAIVISADDNSIPYETWGLINSKLKADNFHLG